MNKIKKREEELIQKNIRTIAKIESYAKSGRTTSDKVADAVSAFCGSMYFLYVHIVWFGIWLGVNYFAPVPEKWRFDPYPFEFLTFVVSLEAIFLSTFVLISQNRENKVTERRNHLDLQINLLAEQENSKMLHMLKHILKRLGVEENDPEVAALTEATDPDRLAQQIQSIIEHDEQ